MPAYSFSIPWFIPHSVNVLMRMHPKRANMLKRGDKDVVAFYFQQAGIPRAEGKRRLSVKYTTCAGRPPDADNLMKSLLDALTACGALVDDGPRWLVLGQVEHERGERATVVVLEDVQDKE